MAQAQQRAGKEDCQWLAIDLGAANIRVAVVEAPSLAADANVATSDAVAVRVLVNPSDGFFFKN
jgi:hexokinase